MTARFDLVTIGNALVDVLSPVPDSFVEAQAASHGMVRGSMMLIEQSRATELYGAMPPAIESSGGSAGNTMAGFASFGGKGAYIGKVAKDQLGEVFSHDMKAQGVEFTTRPLVDGEATGRCLILVTPDGQRTMNTFLGAAVTLSPSDIDEAIVSHAQITYLEGYLYDRDHAKAAFIHAAKIAKAAGRKTALSLSDSFCVDRHRGDFLDLVKNHIDILFANEQEIISLYQTATFEEAAALVKADCDVAVLTRGAQGSLILAGAQSVEIKAAPVTQLVDTTGAGDQYAAGFLYGYTQGFSLEECGRLASLAAAEVISHMGPRPAMAYSDFLDKAAA